MPAPRVEQQSPLDQWQNYVADAARQFGIPDTWIRGVMRAESGGQAVLHGKPITSPKGAMGLMQVMPGTYRVLRQQYGLGDDAYDPRDNIFAGAAYLRQMYERYGYPSLFAAYNAGPKRLDDFLLHGQSLPRETLNYVGSIVPGAETALSNAASAPQIPRISRELPTAAESVLEHFDSLFFTRTDGHSVLYPAAGNPSPASQTIESDAGFPLANSGALFVPLSSGPQVRRRIMKRSAVGQDKARHHRRLSICLHIQKHGANARRTALFRHYGFWEVDPCRVHRR
jgi:hypothetical protein